MIRVLLVTLAFSATTAFAQMDVKTAKASAHNFTGLLSMQTGGVSLGAGYEYMWDTSTGVGAHLRTFSKREAGTGANAGDTTSHGFMIFGASLGHHFFKGKWDLAFTPSFNIINIDSLSKANPAVPDDTMAMGPGMSISLVWLLTERISAGFDYSNYFVWFGDSYKGPVLSDFALKVKASF